ncbi:protein PHLOEM PROTEIN 2-LIKE A10-like [Hibiscus syriacus]|uniref:Protein PHLOEM PROTEIN 2-LIKE A10-like n=1 Tax=Hibiscus syriacus TaxID=106335 RepID=A0A6A3CVV0_HIBSY|nr:uncharacterized protein LOC120156374 [Hibiscus syriacus]KAE8731311.1 protein PHLOEM PROTEIN 2-LIKE A10-like [Hibiscus syriacus]
MSWLARSLATSFRLDEDDNVWASSSDEGIENDIVTHGSQSPSPTRPKIQSGEANAEQQSLSPEQVTKLQSRGVKEDLTELKQTLTRQLWGVASFLAPPPPRTQFNRQSNDRSFSDSNQPEPSDRSVCRDGEDLSDSEAVAGIRDDFAEIGVKLSKMASDYFSFGSGQNEEENDMENESDNAEEEDQELNAVGITDEVLAFARNIAHHPETWLDFPLDPEEDLDDFDMSVSQRDHAMAIEHLAPRLAALRIELSPCHMSDSYFWKVYFVLLHPRLNKKDTELLATPQVVEARALWMKELRKQTKPESDWYGRTSLGDNCGTMHDDVISSSCSYFHVETMSPRTYVSEPASCITTDFEIENHPVESIDMPFVDKPVIVEKTGFTIEDKEYEVCPSSKTSVPKFEDDEIDWPEDDESEFGGYRGAEICVENEEDFSFSDLEDVDDYSFKRI